MRKNIFLNQYDASVKYYLFILFINRVLMCYNKFRVNQLYWTIVSILHVVDFQTVILKDWPFKRQPHKMVKRTQTICRKKPTSCLSVFDHFVGLALKGLILLQTAFMSFCTFFFQTSYEVPFRQYYFACFLVKPVQPSVLFPYPPENVRTLVVF